MLQSAVISKSASKMAEHTPERTYRTVSGLPVWNHKSCTMTSRVVGDYIKRNLIPNIKVSRKNCLLRIHFLPI
jgi:hypothetical protein